MNIIDIPLEQIELRDRLRSIDDDHAQVIAASMALHGQMTPIEVRRDESGTGWLLVSGAHRHRAAQLAGLETLSAIVFEGSSDEAQLREVDENLARHELSELDRAFFLSTRKRIYERLYPETKLGANQYSVGFDKIGETARFTLATAEKLGLSERSVQRALARANLAPDVRTRIAGTWLANHGAQLDALVKATPAEQRKAVALLFREKEPLPNVAAALRAVRGIREEAPAEHEEQLRRLMGAWKKAGARARRLFIEHLEELDMVEARPAKREAA